MEIDFDKEIDAMLRKARADGPVLVGDVAGSRHLDADQIAAFAENLLPERSRMSYMSHLADCGRCRKILADVLVLNSEAAQVAVAAPGVITIAERELPWYRKLFLFPNLAYVMGGLVLVFGGFLAFTVIQNSRLASGDMVTQVTEDSRESGPSFQYESPVIDQSAANTAANVAVSNSTAGAANANAAIGPTPMPGSGSGPRAGETNFLTDGVAAGAQPAPAPPPAAATTGNAERDDLAAAKEKNEDKDVAATTPREPAKTDTMLRQQQYSNMPAQSGPSRQNESQYRAQLENSDNRALAKRSAARNEEAPGRKVVGGKTFERKQGVWYDVNYQGRPTINVRRGSQEFDRLDAGLRSIANSLSGTVVVVWGAKAYRIQ